MFSPKFAAALSKALAARSSVELTAAAITTAAVVSAAVVGQDNNANNATESSKRQTATTTTMTSHAKVPQIMTSLFSNAQTAGGATTTTSCEAFLPQSPPTATMRRVSRLARRRTIQKMSNTSTKASLSSKYIVDKKPLGEGAFGQVFVARHRVTNERVAIKKIPKKFTSDLNFQREMEALLHIRQQGGHPNICALKENFDEGEFYYLVLDLVSGGEMFDHLCEQGPYSEADAARLIREVAGALAFCHGIGCVHGDLKPENLMLSSDNPLHAVIKIVDFGCAQVTKEKDILPGECSQGEDPLLVASNTIANTPAYCPPEILDKEIRKRKGMANYNKLDPTFDMWALGVILYIMLTGFHPFDVDGTCSDEEVEQRIINRQAPPLRNSEMTEHLSESAISLIEQLIQWDPAKRLTAEQMLEHPWVRGETARTGKMADSDKRLSSFKAYKSKLEAKVFSDMVAWSDNLADPVNQQTSLLERAFHNLDGSKRGYLTKNDLRRLSGHKDKDVPSSPRRAQATSAKVADDEALSLSTFSELLSENLKNRYFPKGHVVYREGDEGNQMFFINSGTIQVSTSDGHQSNRTQGDTFGEGALLNQNRRNTSTIRCLTPVHAIEISREYFDKYLNAEDATNAKIQLSEKDKSRKRQRARQLLRNQKFVMPEVELRDGESLFNVGQSGEDLYILEKGKADVVVKNGKTAFSIEPGETCGLHAIAFNRPRNSAVVCASPEGCIFRSVNKQNFDEVLERSPWWVVKSFRDILLRREFMKAIVAKTGKSFPTTDEKLMREMFNAADVNNSGALELENLRVMLKSFEETFTDDDVKEILDALDLDESGTVSFEEFKRLFSARPSTAS